jgi:hypothetical protein
MTSYLWLMNNSDLSDKECIEMTPFHPWGTDRLLIAAAVLSFSARSRGLIVHVTVLSRYYVVLLSDGGMVP